MIPKSPKNIHMRVPPIKIGAGYMIPMKNINLNHMKNLSRREFIRTSSLSSIMLASSAGAILNSCSSSGWQIGCYTRAWGKRNYLEALDGIVEAGYNYVGLSTHDKGRVVDRDSPPEFAITVGEEIRKRGLKILSLSGGSFDPTVSVDEGIAQLKRLIDNSVHCGSSNIQINDIGSMRQPELEPNYYKVIAECCDYGVEKGVSISLKPHGSTGAQCRAHVDRIGHKNLKLWYDPGNVMFFSAGKVNPVEDAEALDGVVVGMAVKDFRLPRTVMVTPGTGLVDFPALIPRLEKGGFQSGPLIIECVEEGDFSFIKNEAIKAREFIEGIVS